MSTDAQRADTAHERFTETIGHLQRGLATLADGCDAYPDDSGKIVATAVAMGTLTQSIRQVEALDIAAQAWKGGAR